MMDEPVGVNSTPSTANTWVNECESNLPEDCKEDCCKMCCDRTVDDLDKISQFFSAKASELRNKLTSNVTMDDFEKIKKGGDKEESDDY